MKDVYGYCAGNLRLFVAFSGGHICTGCGRVIGWVVW